MKGWKKPLHACNGNDKTYNTSNAYSFIDAGCGNGWLVRYLFENTKCVNGIGVDGSNKMIKKQDLLIILERTSILI